MRAARTLLLVVIIGGARLDVAASSMLRLTFLGQSTKPPARAAPDLAAGKTLYDKKCRRCHGSEGQGGSQRLEKVLGARPKALRSEEIQRKSDQQLATTISEGKGKMKPIKNLTPAEIRKVVAYVRTLRQQ